MEAQPRVHWPVKPSHVKD